MFLKIYYTGPLLVRFGHEIGPLFQLNLRDLSFKVRVLNEDLKVKMEDLYLGEITLGVDDYWHRSLEDILENKYKEFYGKKDLLMDLAKHHSVNDVFKIELFNEEKEVTGQQILDLLDLR